MNIEEIIKEIGMLEDVATDLDDRLYQVRLALQKLSAKI